MKVCHRMYWMHVWSQFKPSGFCSIFKESRASKSFSYTVFRVKITENDISMELKTLELLEFWLQGSHSSCCTIEKEEMRDMTGRVGSVKHMIIETSCIFASGPKQHQESCDIHVSHRWELHIQFQWHLQMMPD